MGRKFSKVMTDHRTFMHHAAMGEGVLCGGRKSSTSFKKKQFMYDFSL